MCAGRCDVIKDGKIWELKFKNDVPHEDFLQLACYLASRNVDKGVLWNVKTNEKWEVEVPDKEAFLDAVVPCITKGYVQDFERCSIPEYQNIKRSRKSDFCLSDYLSDYSDKSIEKEDFEFEESQRDIPTEKEMADEEINARMLYNNPLITDSEIDIDNFTIDF